MTHRITYTLVVLIVLTGCGPKYTAATSPPLGVIQDVRISQTNHADISGWLEAGDGVLSNGSYYEDWLLEITEPDLFRICMSSVTMDSYLLLSNGVRDDPGFRRIASNDDGGYDGNALIERRLDPGVYTITATTYRRDTGHFALRILRGPAPIGRVVGYCVRRPEAIDGELKQTGLFRDAENPGREWVVFALVMTGIGAAAGYGYCEFVREEDDAHLPPSLQEHCGETAAFGGALGFGMAAFMGIADMLSLERQDIETMLPRQLPATPGPWLPGRVYLGYRWRFPHR